MKKLLIFLLSVVVSVFDCHSQTIPWARFIPTEPYSALCDVLTDDSSNVYTLYNYGFTDPAKKGKSFLVKVTPSGRTIWQKPDTSGFYKAITKSPTDIYAGGKSGLTKYTIDGGLTWRKEIRIDDITYYKGHLYATLDNYFFKMDTAGNIVWSKSLDLYGTMHVEPGEEGFLYVQAGSGGINPYHVLKFNSFGNLVWSKAVPGIYLNGMSTDEVGNVYITGQFGGSAVFDNITLKCTECFYAENYYLARLNSNGNWDWARPFENSSGGSLYCSPFNEYLFTGEIKASGIDSANAILGVYSRKTGKYQKGIRFPRKGYYEITDIGYTGDFVYIGGSLEGPGAQVFLARIDDADFLNEMLVGEPENTGYQLNVFPNPTDGVFQLVYSAPESGKLLLTILDPNGGLFYTENIARFQGEFKRSIDLRNSIKGVYIIEIVSDKEKKVERLVYN